MGSVGIFLILKLIAFFLSFEMKCFEFNKYRFIEIFWVLINKIWFTFLLH